MIGIEGMEKFQADVERLRAALDRFPEMATSHLEDVVTQALMLLATYAAEYPPPPSGSGYRRTGTLGRLWTAARPEMTIGGHVLEARISNAVPYGPWVQHPDKQAPIHRGRWQTTDEVVQAHLDEVSALLAQAGLEIVEQIVEAV